MIKKWWMESVGYQIYPKSFYDSNNDGIGDIQGIISKLNYLHDLGVDLIWICPVYDSPMDDNGYDVRNFYDIAEMFGTLDDMKVLIKRAHDLGIKIIMDYVLNHTSDEHPWFIESRKSKDNPYRDYYIWADGKIVDHQWVEPTNWGSFFGGSCWQFDQISQSYYMKIFSNKMPDLNWKNKKVRQEMLNVGKWWLDLGIDGFRIDAVSHLGRKAFEDIKDSKDRYPLDASKFSNLDIVHDYLKDMHQQLFKPNDVLAIGEVGGNADLESKLSYASFDSNQLSMVFTFDHNWCNNVFDINDIQSLKTNVKDLKRIFNDWQMAFKDKGWVPLNWLNHDQPRLLSHYGSQIYPKRSAKMLAQLMYLMRGTPFLYQGEEIGMTNYPFEDVSSFDDISSINYYKYLTEEKNVDKKEALFKTAIKSRDNARTPMQWDDSKYAGFSSTKPWMPVNPDYHQVNVKQALSDQGSIWHYYKKLFALRKESKYSETIIYGDIAFIDLEDEESITYKRFDQQYTLLMMHSFSLKEKYVDLSTYKHVKIVLSNDQDQTVINKKLLLKPYGAIVLEVEQ